MASKSKIDGICNRPLEEHIRQRVHLGALQRYLTERGHARGTIRGYLDCAAHFCHWAERSSLDLARTDERLVERFRDAHLSRCDCGWPTRSDRGDAGAALGHLLLVLRTLGLAAPSAAKTTPVDEELQRFDQHMDQVRGLAPKTRQSMLRIVRSSCGSWKVQTRNWPKTARRRYGHVVRICNSLIYWRSLRDSNPCYSLERAMSWASRRRERCVAGCRSAVL